VGEEQATQVLNLCISLPSQDKDLTLLSIVIPMFFVFREKIKGEKETKFGCGFVPALGDILRSV
jgi:hypothetical protein